MERRSSKTILIVLVTLFAGAVAAEQDDPVPAILANFANSDWTIRASAVDALIALGDPGLESSAPDNIPAEMQNVLNAYPNDKKQIISAMIDLLATENANSSNPEFNSTITDETFDDYYGSLIDAVASLNSPSAIPVLAASVQTGGFAIDGLVAQAPISIPAILPLVYSQDITTRHAAAIALQKMVSPDNFAKVKDTTSLSNIRAALTIAANSFTGSYKPYRADFLLVVDSLPSILTGDLNGDGKVNCADLELIKASFGKSVGQTGFDIRADVNGDGVVNILDLSAEAKLLPAGTKCE